MNIQPKCAFFAGALFALGSLLSACGGANGGRECRGPTRSSQRIAAAYRDNYYRHTRVYRRTGCNTRTIPFPPHRFVQSESMSPERKRGGCDIVRGIAS